MAAWSTGLSPGHSGGNFSPGSGRVPPSLRCARPLVVGTVTDAVESWNFQSRRGELRGTLEISYSRLLPLWLHTEQICNACLPCTQHSVKFFPHRFISTTILCNRCNYPPQGGGNQGPRCEIFHLQRSARICTRDVSDFRSYILSTRSCCLPSI